MRSHAQKVLKDYSPNSNNHELDGSKSEMTEHANNESMSIHRDHTVRTDEPNFGGARLDLGQP